MKKNETSFFGRMLVQAALALCALVSTLVSAQTPQTAGRWENGPNLPFVPVHSMLRPDSSVMFWYGEQPGQAGSRVWNPATAVVTTVSSAGFDIFCTGHTFLPDGRLFVAGGHIQNNVGLPEAAIYNPVTNTWTRQPAMNLGRWYPTTTALPNGDVLVVSGDVDTTVGTNPLPQVWQSTTGTWRDLTSAQLSLPLYPYMFLAPNGSVFSAGPEVVTRYLNTAGTGAWTAVGNRTFNGWRDYGGAVMYAPGKILTVGGADPPTDTAEVIDLNAGSPLWRAVGSMSTPRRQMNITVLADGKVLATGGTRGAGFNNAGSAVFAAELWDPATEAWTTMAAGTVPRLYHSIALLLPDARVLVGGGDGHTQTEIYSPPYLFAGPRPSISSAPATAGKGQSVFIGTPDATGITGITWVALPSVTHSNNMNQSVFRSASITQGAGGITITAPDDPTVPAGFYMLFLLRNGVPSVANIVQLGPLSGNPVPSLASMAPSSAITGGAAFSLSVTGANFANDSKVRWNGVERPTTFVSATQLTAAIPASDIAAAGNADVAVFSPAPGGGTSQPRVFEIAATPLSPPDNPAPVLTSISPASASAGGPAFTLTAVGTGFVATSRVRWNGAERPTTFVSATQLTAAIPAGDLATVGSVQVAVVTPGPGGGSTALQAFTISGAIPPPTAAEQNLTAAGTIIARITAPTGGGSRNIQIIRDGVMPAAGTARGWSDQYDTYDGANAAPDDWIGYQYGTVQTFNRVMFQEGINFADGGWFTALTVQVRQGGSWVNVSSLASTPAYPGVNNGINYQSYNLRFAPISGDAIRIFGTPGGSAAFISVAELLVYGDGTATPPPPVSNPVPALTSLAPASAATGSAAFTLTVNGSNFIAGSTVRWGGADRATTFVNATRVTAVIPAADVAAAGSVQVAVFNPAPGGGLSPAQTFTIAATPPPPPPPGTEQNLTATGTVIARVTAPLGGGSRNIQVIRDGVTPAAGSGPGWSDQYDTYDGANFAPEDWIGYQYASAQTFTRVMFQEGINFADGGWFNSLIVQVRQGGSWVTVPGLASTPAYPGANNARNYETYSLQFPAISGDAIRIYGAPGGSAAFISVAELRVFGP